MRITAAQIVREVAEKHGITKAELLGPSQSHRYVLPRFEAYYRCFTECPHLSLPAIGRAMGGKDHTSVRNGVQRYCQLNGLNLDHVKALRYGLTHPETQARMWRDYEAVMREARAA